VADYFFPTVVQPTIAAGDIAPIERLLLNHIFTAEPDGDEIYFYAEHTINDLPVIPIDDVRAALVASEGMDSSTAVRIGDEIAKRDANDAYFQLDFSLSGWEAIFQDIVRRSATIEHVTVVSAWTCSKMRPDGFGGMAIVITGTDVMVNSTNSMIDQMIGIAQYGPVGVEPGLGDHVLLTLSEEHIRTMVDSIIKTSNPERLIAAVSNDDIREASLAIVAADQFAFEGSAATFNAAIAAIDIAASRQQKSA